MPDLQSTSESLLIRLRTASDSDAWAQFVRLYSPLIFFWARKNGMSHDDAGDIVQDVLSIVFRKLHTWKYDSQRSFRGWLRKITLNRHRELVRRKKIPVADESLTGIPDPRAAAETSWDANYHRQLIASAMDLMQSDFAPKTWEALKLLIGSDRTATEIAAQTGVSVWTIYAARNRLFSRLRKELNGLME